jgi:hypothetical protein
MFFRVFNMRDAAWVGVLRMRLLCVLFYLKVAYIIIIALEETSILSLRSSFRIVGESFQPTHNYDVYCRELVQILCTMDDGGFSFVTSLCMLVVGVFLFGGL